MQRTYQELEQFLAGYFNQDWEDDYASADDVIQAFENESALEEVEKVRGQLKELLETDLTETEMRTLLFDTYTCSYYYLSEWASAKDWIKHVLDVLAK